MPAIIILMNASFLNSAVYTGGLIKCWKPEHRICLVRTCFFQNSQEHRYLEQEGELIFEKKGDNLFTSKKKKCS